MKISKPRFTAEAADRAYDEWGANCGPGAIAAICGLTLDELRPHMGDFEGKRYTTAQVAEILDISHSAAYERIKRRPHPLTWADLQKARMR